MPTNIDNVLISGIPTVTTTAELREWLLNRNLPGVITEEGFQQNVSMYEESSSNFEENNDTFLQELVVGNEFYQVGGFFNNGAIGNFGLDGPTYSESTPGELTLDTVTNSSGSEMPHIECEFPEYVIPVMSSTLCEINLYTINATYDPDTTYNLIADNPFYEVPTSDGTPVKDTYNPERFGNLPQFMLGNFDNSYTNGLQYNSGDSEEFLSLVQKTQANRPSGDYPSWFDSNPLMYDLFISPNFDGNFMRFDATTLELGPMDNRFYGLKISERGFQYNNAAAPDGTGVKTLYTPLQPYNDNVIDAPSVMIQNTRILEQWILGAFGTRITRDSLLLRNMFTSANMYIGSTDGVPAVDYSEGTVSLNNDYLSLAWVLSGPRKPKSTTNYFVQQLNIADSDPTYLAGGRGEYVFDNEFGKDRALIWDEMSGEMIESNAAWAPVGTSDIDFIVHSFSDTGSKGLLDYTQKIVNRSADGVSGGIGDSIRQDTSWINTKHGPKSRGSGIKSYDEDDQNLELPYSRSWKRTTRYSAQGDKPKSYSRYDALIRHSQLVKDGQGWSGGQSVLEEGGVAHIAQSSKEDIRRFMFSLENLAWKDEAFSRLAPHERGPHNGRLMWFPPYIESWTENSSANWTQTDIIGRTEPIFTYKNAYRQTNLNFLMVTDYPEVIDTMKENKEWSDTDSDMQAAQFFGGENFESKHRDNILQGKKLVYSTQEQHDKLDDQLAEVPIQDPNDYSQPYEIPDVPGINPETEPLKVWYFSGCSEANTTYVYPYEWQPPLVACNECAQRWDAQFEDAEQTTGSFQNRDNEDVCGMKWGLEDLAKFLATDAGKRFKVKITYFKAPMPNNNQAGSVVTGGFNVAYEPGQIFTGDYEIWNDEIVLVPSTMSDEAIEGIQEDYEVCGPIRAKEAKKALQDLIVAAEGSAENKEKWYSDEAAPDGSSVNEDERWQIVSGPEMKWGEQMMKPNWQDIPLNAQEQAYEQTQMNVLPVSYLIEFNPNLTSDDAQKEAKEEYRKLQQEVTDTFNTTNTRIPDGTYFEKVQKTDSFAYQTFKEKIQNFNPAFHAMHPCMLNERMTFLNQCLRPGPSIEGIVGPNNMAFGRPPVCVLRLGDFYNCKVVINNVDFSYEQPLWDLNPEGIGAQPWLVRVSMQMFIVGGMSLAGPLSQLQNATSFNYFANTEICEPVRSNPNFNTTPGPPPVPSVPPSPPAPPPQPCDPNDCDSDDPNCCDENPNTPPPAPPPCDPNDCDSDDPNCCDDPEPCNPNDCDSDDPDCCEQQPGDDLESSNYVAEVWYGYGGYFVMRKLWDNVLNSDDGFGTYYGYTEATTPQVGLQIPVWGFTLWVDEMSSETNIKNYRVRWRYPDWAIDGADKSWDSSDPNTKHKTAVFADPSGCVAAKTAGCQVLMDKIKEAQSTIVTWFTQEINSNVANWKSDANAKFADGTTPQYEPSFLLYYCYDKDTGDPFTNPNWETCIDDPSNPQLDDYDMPLSTVTTGSLTTWEPAQYNG